MTKKKTIDTIGLAVVPADGMKTQKAFCAAVNRVLPDLGQWEYTDRRKALGFYRVEIHPELPAEDSEARKEAATAWLEDARPKLEVVGLRIIEANVRDRELVRGIFPIGHNIFGTKEYYERMIAADTVRSCTG